MLVRYYWPNYEVRPEESDENESIHAFWVEATLEEAEKNVFPLISEETRRTSYNYAKQFIFIAEQIMQPPHPYCFLVTRDLSTIEPFEVHYPFHHMWNAYSPFRRIDTHEIDNLDQIASISCQSCGKHTDE